MVITWNLHGPAGDLPGLVRDLRDGDLLGVPAAAFALLLQEAPPGVRAQAEELNLFAHYAPVTAVRGNAILSTAPLTDVREVELPRARQRRVAVVAAIPFGAAAVRLATAHFENRVSWIRGGLFSERARLRQAEALIAALAPGPPTIVGGDFNAWLGRQEPAWRALAGRFPDGPAPLGRPTFRERLFLDELFFDLPESWRAERRVIERRYGSDHHAVAALVSTR